MRHSLRKLIFPTFLLICFLDLSGQTDSLETELIMGRIREILEVYNDRTVYVDTSEYVHGFEGADDINLQTAASTGACSEIIRLVSRGADVNTHFGFIATPLHYAVNSGKWEAVEILLLLGAKPDAKDTYGNTPLIVAVRADQQDIAEKLIRYGASINNADRQRSSPLHHSTVFQNFSMTDMLLYYDSPTELFDMEGNTPLMLGVCFGYHEIADLLLQSGADPNAADSRGFTPLMAASQDGDTLMMSILAEAGANLYALNNDGIDALGCAVIGSQKEAAEFLLRHGNRWDHTNGTIGDPVKLANACGESHILKLMNDHGLKSKRVFNFNQLSFSAGVWYTPHYKLAGGSLSVSEPGLGAGITLGAAVDPGNQRVLVDGDDGTIYQYNIRSNLIYAGLFREFPLTSKLNELRVSVVPVLNFGYMFHSLYAGTEEKPDDKLYFIPEADIRFSWKSLSLNPGLAIMKTPFRKIGPLWFTFKVTCDLKRPQNKIRGKRIRIYNYE